MARQSPRKNRQRSRRRESHHHASLEASGHPLPTIPEHPLIPANDAPFIDEPEALATLIDHVRQMGQFAYDTEFIGELSYYPHICVVQIATSERVALIDPLADLDLTGVWELIADPDVVTLVHAGLQDLEPVVRYLDRPPANVIDIQVAAGFVHLPYPVALAKLMHTLLGVSLGKGFTFTQWDHRPLSPQHQRYAADDVRYLPAAWDELRRRLEAAGHLEHVAEECRSFEQTQLYHPDPRESFLRVRGAQTLKPKNLAILRELAVWRDRAARDHDLPPRTFVKDEVLVRLAREPVKSEIKLAQVRGLPRPVIEACASQILDHTAAGLAAPSEERPQVARIDETPEQRVEIEALWATAKSLCLGQGIDFNLVTSRATIAQFYLLALKHQSLDHLDVMQGWRRRLVGEPLLALLRGQTRLTLTWSKGHLHIEEASV